MGVSVIFDPIAISTDTAPIKIELFEGSTVSNGTDVIPTQTNRQNHLESSVSVKSAPTVSAQGNLIFSTLVTGDKHAGGSSNNKEHFYLKQSTTYVYKITNSSNQFANIANWFDVG